MKASSLRSLSDCLRKSLRSDMLLTSSSIVSEDNSSSILLKFNSDDSMAINCARLRFPWLSDLSTNLHFLLICISTSTMLHLLFSSFSLDGGMVCTQCQCVKKINKNSFTFSKSSSFSPLASLYLFEQCLRLGVMGTSSVCLPLQD